MRKVFIGILLSVGIIFSGLAGYWLYFEARYKIIVIKGWVFKYDKWTDSFSLAGERQIIKSAQQEKKPKYPWRTEKIPTKPKIEEELNRELRQLFEMEDKHAIEDLREK